jgi:hypothetical protein
MGAGRMNAELTIAGTGCAALAAGHAMIGRFVLPALRSHHLPATPFGPPPVTVGMLRFTWHIVTVMLLAFSVLLMTLAAGVADPKTLLLRWFAAFWLIATATSIWVARRRIRGLLRPPLPMLFVVIAVMCWVAST